MKNVVNNQGEEISNLGGFEYAFMKILKRKLKDFNEYLFVIYGNNGNELPLSRFIQHDKKILIWRSNENKLNRVSELKKQYNNIYVVVTLTEDLRECSYQQEWQYVVENVPCPDMGHERCLAPISELLSRGICQSANLLEEEVIAMTPPSPILNKNLLT